MIRAALSLALVFASSAALACPDMRNDADAKPAYLDKMAAAQPQMTPVPAQAVSKVKVTKTAAKAPGTATAAVAKKPSGG